MKEKEILFVRVLGRYNRYIRPPAIVERWHTVIHEKSKELTGGLGFASVGGLGIAAGSLLLVFARLIKHGFGGVFIDLHLLGRQFRQAH